MVPALSDVATLHPDRVEEALAKVGTRFVSVACIDSKGKPRKFTGHLRAAKHMSGEGARSAAKTASLAAKRQTAIYCTRSGFRSFSNGRVTAITCGNVVNLKAGR